MSGLTLVAGGTGGRLVLAELSRAGVLLPGARDDATSLDGVRAPVALPGLGAMLVGPVIRGRFRGLVESGASSSSSSSSSFGAADGFAPVKSLGPFESLSPSN